ncbi:unnamed protein product, partial [Ceratitis capitata]
TFPGDANESFATTAVEEAEKAFNFYNAINMKSTQDPYANKLQISSAKIDFDELKSSKIQGGEKSAISLRELL